MKFRTIEVKDKITKKKFLDVARYLYKGDPNWVCPLDNDINDIFNPERNNFYKHGDAKRWVLVDDEGRVEGRIAAFYDNNTAWSNEQPTGGCGFFECINDQVAADILFNTAKEWLISKGMEAMDGPINFGETDKFWGLLVKGFTQPAYQIAYNLPYYQALFENYGFKIYFNQEGFHLDLKKEIPQRFWKIAAWVAKKPDYEFLHFSYKNIDKYVSDFTTVFNEAWRDFKDNFEPLQESYVKHFITKARPIIEERFIWFAYNKNRPIAIYMMYPDVNQIFKHFNGKLNLLNKIRLLYMVRNKKMNRARGMLMGVVPAFQGLGIESAFIWHLNEVFKELTHYRELEFSWVGDFNPPMRKLWESVGAVSAKHYITYRFLFDTDKPFKRYPIPE